MKISIIVSVILYILIIFSIPATAEANLIANPGFEFGTYFPLNWTFFTINNNTPAISNISHTGSRSIEISVPGTTDLQSGYPASDKIYVHSSTTYTFTAWGRTENANGTNPPALRLVELDVNNNSLSQIDLLVFRKGTNDWEEKKAEFKTGPDTSYFYVYANIFNGFGNLWLDDLSINLKDNLIENPGFEYGTYRPLNWTFFPAGNNTPSLSNISHSGSRSIEINIPGTTDAQSGYPASDVIDVRSGTTYTFTVWGKTENANGTNPPLIRIAELDNNMNLFNLIDIPFNRGSNDWEQRQVNFKTNLNTTHIYIYAGIWNGYGTFWMDDVALNHGDISLHPPIITPIPGPAPSPPQIPDPAPAPAPEGKVFYVAKNGNDRNPGTESQPWLTIRKAANTLAAGETVYIKNGTYNEMVTIKNSGLYGSYISFSAYPGDIVTLDGSGLKMDDWSGLFWIKGKNYIKINGFNLINGKNGIDVDSGSDIIIKDNYIENPYNTGIKVGWGYASNIIIDGNRIKKNVETKWNEMISISNGHNIEVKNNHIMENVIGEGIDMKDGTSNSTIHHNIVEKVSSAGIYIDGYSDGVSNIEIYENTVHHSNIGFSTGSERGGLAENIYFHDNTAYKTNTGYRKSYWAEKGFKVQYKNIVFSNNKAWDNSRDYSGI